MIRRSQTGRMTTRAGGAERAAVPAPLLILGSVVSIQAGQALGKGMFPVAGTAGVVVLRLGFAAAVLLLVRRPPRGDVRRQGRAAEVGDGGIQRRPVKGERQRDRAVFAFVLDLCVEVPEQADPALVAEPNDVAPRELPGRLDQRLPA